MKYNTWREAHSELKHGDTVWAVRLQDATGTEKPVFCILLAHMTKAELDRDPNPPRYYPRWLLGCDPDTKQPIWDRPYNPLAFGFATTEREINEMYNDKIQQGIQAAQARIDELKTYLIPLDEETADTVAQ